MGYYPEQSAGGMLRFICLHQRQKEFYVTGAQKSIRAQALTNPLVQSSLFSV